MKNWLVRIVWALVILVFICPLGPIIFGGGTTAYLIAVAAMAALCVFTSFRSVVWNSPGCPRIRWAFAIIGLFLGLLLLNGFLKSAAMQNVKNSLAYFWNSTAAVASTGISNAAPTIQNIGATATGGINTLSTNLWQRGANAFQQGRVVPQNQPFLGTMEYDVGTNWSGLIPVDKNVQFSIKAGRPDMRLQIKRNQSDAPEDNFALPAQLEVGYAAVVAAIGKTLENNVTTLQFMIPPGSICQSGAVQVLFEPKK